VGQTEGGVEDLDGLGQGRECNHTHSGPLPLAPIDNPLITH